MAKIKTITVSNLKAISDLSIDFKGCTAIITGGNNKGKSSFLKSLSDRLRGIKPEKIVKQGEKDGYYEMELTTGEKFMWSFNTTTKVGEKLTFISERNIPSAVTKELSKYYFPEIFDVDTFLQSTPKKQKETLQKLSDIDFSEFDKEYRNAFEQRTFLNKQLAEDKAKAELINPSIGVEITNTEALEIEYAGIEAHNLQHKIQSEKLQNAIDVVDANSAKIDALMLEIQKYGEENEALNIKIEAAKLWVNDEKNKPKSSEVAQNLKAKIEAIKANNIAIDQDIKIRKAIENATAADVEVKRLDALKLDTIKNSTLPNGFGFSEDGITYNGFDFNREQLSSSGLYIAALKLAAMGLGEVKTLHFDASFLDKNSLAEIEVWAKENDLQLLIERPDFEGGEIKYEILEK
jgi:AAA15 family ATPase/GTPase